MWTSEFVEPHDTSYDSNQKQFRFVLSDLRPNNRYAYYVEAKVSLNDKSPVNITQGLSPISFFVTLPERPLPPFVSTKNKTKTSVALKWFHPAWDIDRLVERYEVDIYRLHDDGEEVQQRDYCLHPKVRGITDTHKYIAHSESAYFCCESRGFQHTRFVAAYFGLDGDPDMCGDEDPECQNEFKFHMLSSTTHYLKSQLRAIREEELPFLSLPLPDNPEYGDSHLRRPDISERHPEFERTHIIEGPDANEYEFNDLVAFERYAFRVYACNNHTGCSPYYLHFERTLRDFEADTVVITAKKMDDTGGIVVNISPPQVPNGMTVAYVVERSMGSNYEKICMTDENMKRANFK